MKERENDEDGRMYTPLSVLSCLIVRERVKKYMAMMISFRTRRLWMMMMKIPKPCLLLWCSIVECSVLPIYNNI